MNAPPDVIPEGAKAVVVAHADLIGRWTYDLWIVDSQAWDERLRPADALKRLDALGYASGRRRQMLRRARVRADNQARAIGRFG